MKLIYENCYRLNIKQDMITCQEICCSINLILNDSKVDTKSQGRLLFIIILKMQNDNS